MLLVFLECTSTTAVSSGLLRLLLVLPAMPLGNSCVLAWNLSRIVLVTQRIGACGDKRDC